MIAKAKAGNVKLRPNVKTHKTMEIAKLQVDGDLSNGIVCSTLAEVSFFASNGFSDITYGIPITSIKLFPLYQISQSTGCKISLIVDSEVQVDELKNFIEDQENAHFGCFLKIDTGYHRAGVDIRLNRATGLELAQKISGEKNITFRGIYSHSGHGYQAQDTAEAQNICLEECKMARSFADFLIEKGLDCQIVSIGSTPSCGSSNQFPGVTEIHPGNYVFFDRQQVQAGACKEADVAVRVLTRVIGHYESSGHMLCDAGSLAMSKDLAPQDDHFGFVEGCDLVLQSLSQECGKVMTKKTSTGKRAPYNMDDYPRGSLLKIVPNHSCLTAACHPLYYIVENDMVSLCHL
uniref:D-serine dehydratase n=1 Tax=Guillardia theta TaxID=55529 RepID=A0A6U5ZYU2_GUITH